MAREAASPRHQTVSMHVTYLGSQSIKPSEAINVLHFAQICGLTSFCRESRRSPSACPTWDKSSTFSGRRSGASSCSSKCQRQTMASSISLSSRGTSNRANRSYLMIFQSKKCGSWKPSNFSRSSTMNCKLSSTKQSTSMKDSKRSTSVPCTVTVSYTHLTLPTICSV